MCHAGQEPQGCAHGAERGHLHAFLGRLVDPPLGEVKAVAQAEPRVTWVNRLLQGEPGRIGSGAVIAFICFEFPGQCRGCSSKACCLRQAMVRG